MHNAIRLVKMRRRLLFNYCCLLLGLISNAFKLKRFLTQSFYTDRDKDVRKLFAADQAYSVERIQFFNTLTRRKEVFIPISKDAVSFYR